MTSSRCGAVRQYIERVASQDLEEFPEWDLSKPLPKLPVPDLHDTLTKYLLTIKPVVSQEAFEVTEKLVEEFSTPGGEGEKLQAKLKEYAETEESWAYDMWLKDMYMKNPLCLPVNSNPGMVFPHHISNHFIDEKQQLKFAAKLISGILDYKVILDTRSLPTDRANTREKGQPLCMEQYYRLFPSYREPGDPLDCLKQPGNDTDRQYVIVTCKNQFFVLDVVVNGNRLSDENIYSQLRRIVAMAEEQKGDTPPIGVLTTANRHFWARARRKLMNDAVNRKSLSMIEKSIFILCLDKAIPISFNHQSSIDETSHHRRDEVSLASQMLHGLGSHMNSPNRWFDKTMQFIIGADGACGLCYEHSASEGIAVVQLIEHLLKYMDELQKRKLGRMQSISDLPSPTMLQWHMTDDVMCDIQQASESIDRLIADIDMFVLRFEDFGKNFPKSQNMSPDAFIQLALQLTYYRVHGKLVPTYESASIRRFRQGRVDNIRACTLEALEFCKAMSEDNQATNGEKVALMRKAIKKQTEILVDTILGRGIDNHLLGLREMADTSGQNLPDLFADASYQMSNNFILSTSQVPTTMDAFMLYGPVVPDGYGVCYNPHEAYMLFVVTAFNSEVKTVAKHFADVLVDNFKNMQSLCVRSNATNGGVENGITTNDGGREVTNGR